MPAAIKLKIYCCTANIGIDPVSVLPEWSISTYGELFAIEVHRPDGNGTLLSEIVRGFTESMSRARERLTFDRAFPDNWTREIGIQSLDGSRQEIKIRLSGIWRVFEADISLHRLNGAYSHVTEQFIGSQDIRYPRVEAGHPGPGWREVPHVQPGAGTTGITIIHDPGTVEQSLVQISARPLFATAG